MIDYDNLNSSQKKILEAIRNNPHAITSLAVRPTIHDYKRFINQQMNKAYERMAKESGLYD